MNMERLLLAAAVVQSTTENTFVQQQHSSGSSSASGSSLVDYLTSGRSSIDLNGVVHDGGMMIGGLATTQSVTAMGGTNRGENNDVLLAVGAHHTPSYYDQNLVMASDSAVLLHHQQPAVGDIGNSMEHDDCDDDDDDNETIINNGEDFAWMKDKKVARKNNQRKWKIEIWFRNNQCQQSTGSVCQLSVKVLTSTLGKPQCWGSH